LSYFASDFRGKKDNANPKIMNTEIILVNKEQFSFEEKNIKS